MAELRWIPWSIFAVVLAAGACGGSDDATATSDGGADGGEGGTTTDGAAPDPGASVIQHHEHASRDGLYVDPTFTKAKVPGLHLDASFVANVNGPTYAQPLYLEHGPGDKDVLVVATEQNEVVAFDAAGGAAVWKATLAKPVPLAKLKADPGCGNIDPLGITGTPYADLASRTIYLDAMTTPDDGTTKRHLIYALSLDDGSVRPGWPVDVEKALANAQPAPFQSKAQNQRGAVIVVDGVLYVPYGGHAGDCGDYRGWVVGVSVTDPTHVQGWATPAPKGGIWAVNGVSSDGTRMYATSGNTEGATTWGGGEAVLRFGKGPSFSSSAADYFSPSNWQELDAKDLDLGGAAALLVDVPGATPSALVLALGKDRKAYLLDRQNLGGVGHEITSQVVATDEINAAGTTFTTAKGTFVSFRVANGGTGATCPNGTSGNLVTARITAASPPSIEIVWCSKEKDLSSPITTTTGGGADAVVWAMSQSRLIAYDGETGDELFAGGGPADAMSTVQYFETPIVTKGRVFVAALDRLYAFSL